MGCVGKTGPTGPVGAKGPSLIPLATWLFDEFDSGRFMGPDLTFDEITEARRTEWIRLAERAERIMNRENERWERETLTAR